MLKKLRNTPNINGGDNQMEFYTITNEDELAHYGVLGMKWGVRRNIRVLANNRRNRKVRDIKYDYKAKKITKKEKKKLIKEANSYKKSEIKSMRSEVNKAKNKQEFKAVKSRIKDQTLKEVPYSTLKKGATTVNNLLYASNTAGYIGGAAAIALMSPAMVGTAAAIGISGAVVESGRRYVAQHLIDKYS